jgi:hypothetical protein
MPGTDMPTEQNLRGVARQIESAKRKLFIPFLIVVMVLALWAISVASEATPRALTPIIAKLPDGLLKAFLEGTIDISKPVNYYSSRIFVWAKPYADAIITWFTTICAQAWTAFTRWVESL